MDSGYQEEEGEGGGAIKLSRSSLTFPFLLAFHSLFLKGGGEGKGGEEGKLCMFLSHRKSERTNDRD